MKQILNDSYDGLGVMKILYRSSYWLSYVPWPPRPIRHMPDYQMRRAIHFHVEKENEKDI